MPGVHIEYRKVDFFQRVQYVYVFLQAVVSLLQLLLAVAQAAVAYREQQQPERDVQRDEYYRRRERAIERGKQREVYVNLVIIADSARGEIDPAIICKQIERLAIGQVV